MPVPPPGATPGSPVNVSQPAAARKVAILLPLTGSQAELGQNMLRAAQLGYAGPLDARDTGGTPDGAATAARAAVKDGAALLLGPLTSGETGAVAPIARAADVPVLAFTSDPQQARPGVWVMGITPDQQVRRLVDAAAAEGKTRIAAVVPDNAFGAALGQGLRNAAREDKLPVPAVQNYGSAAGIPGALKAASDYTARHSTTESPAPDTAVPAPAAPPPAVDALLLGAVGDQLTQAVPLLAASDLSPGQVRVMGPALWARDAGRLPGLAGAVYAAPDPALRASFQALYTGKYNAPPRDFADLAFDAATIARVAGPAGLFRAEGFAGADGPILLLPNGETRRGLAIFTIDRTGSRLLDPAPRSLQTPAS